MKLPPALFAGAFLLIAAPVDAFHCATYSTSPAEATIDLSAAGGPILYDTNAACAIASFVTNHVVCGDKGFWIYQESNGIAGLQRADEVADDTCHGMIEGDAIVF